MSTTHEKISSVCLGDTNMQVINWRCRVYVTTPKEIPQICLRDTDMQIINWRCRVYVTTPAKFPQICCTRNPQAPEPGARGWLWGIGGGGWRQPAITFRGGAWRWRCLLHVQQCTVRIHQPGVLGVSVSDEGQWYNWWNKSMTEYCSNWKQLSLLHALWAWIVVCL